MKRTVKIKTLKRDGDSVEVAELRKPRAFSNQNIHALPGRQLLMSRGRGQDVIDPYRLCNELRNQQGQRRLHVGDEKSIIKTDPNETNHVFSVAGTMVIATPLEDLILKERVKINRNEK